MAGAIGRVQGASFRECLRQQIAAELAEHLMRGLRTQHAWMQGITGGAGQPVVDSSAELLRAQAPVHEPLLVPDSLQRARRYLRQDCNGVRRAERPEALRGGTVVGIAG